MKRVLVCATIMILNATTFSQNIGIGTPNPLSRLHVYNSASGSTPVASSHVVVESNGHTYISLLSPSANETGIVFGRPGSSSDGTIIYGGPSVPNGFQFRNNGNQTRMIIANNGNVGIGPNTPAFPLSFSPVTGDKISLWSNTGNSYGFGIQSSLLQIHTDVIAADIVFGYGSSLSFTENMRIKGNGMVGIGTNVPSATLDVNGSLKSYTVTTPTLTISTGGSTTDFLIKSDAGGTVGFRKSHTGVGLNYIIAIEGEYPDPNVIPQGTILGEIKLVSGNVAPKGWAFCNGQLMAVNLHPQLFTLIGTTYGGNGQTFFQLPDMRNTVPVGPGSNWGLGERSN